MIKNSCHEIGTPGRIKSKEAKIGEFDSAF